MKTVYEASHSTEAHMLLDLLKQQGIPAHLLGEHLQGAIGELPASGLVRIVAAEEDFAAAREVITAWETMQQNPDPAQPLHKLRSRGLPWFAIGTVAGAVLMYAMFRSPVNVDGTDYNRDGVLDERWSHSPAGRPVKGEIDRNLDGRIDYVSHHDVRGLVEGAESDDDFNGTFESRHRFRNGNAEFSESDSDDDGYPDIRWRYTNGVLASMEYMDPSTGRPLRVEHYKLGRLLHADVDTDKDGRLETRRTYTVALEIARTQAID